MNSVTMAYLKLHWNRFRNAWRPWLIFFFIYLAIVFHGPNLHGLRAKNEYTR